MNEHLLPKAGRGAFSEMKAPGLQLTDLYQLNMMQAQEAGMTETAVFELFVRKLPPTRNFLVAAGIEQAVEFLEGAAFTDDELAWLDSQRRFSPAFLQRLAGFRFTGDLDAVTEGEIVFADEPLVRVVAPLPEAQLMETRLINLVHFQTVIASKAARLRLAAGERRLIDFGLRRAHCAEAGLLAARASYLAGFDGTATVEAGRRYGIPISGTMAHSFIQAHDDEVTAFHHFAKARPDNLVLLLDTYDTERAAEKVVALAPQLAAEGIALSGVRLDSGDLGEHAGKVRAILDAGGLAQVQIFASGGLDEHTSPAFVRAVRQSTASASARRSRRLRTRRPWTAPTSSTNTPGTPAVSSPKARQPGRAASRSTAAPTIQTGPAATC